MLIDCLITSPIRTGLTIEEKWKGQDKGLIACWERGLEMAAESPDTAAAAIRGELIPLPWKGGLEKAIKSKNKVGTLFYYAMWIGLCGDNLYIDSDAKYSHTCTKHGVTVVFSGRYEDYANA